MMKVFVVGFATLLFGITSLANVQISTEAFGSHVGEKLASVPFTGEDDKSLFLDTAEYRKAVLLVPIYAHCGSSCPLIVANLKSALSQVSSHNFDVILFDFDTSDQARDLTAFRENLSIPHQWKIWRANKIDTGRILDSIGFRYMTQDKVYLHPSVVVVLSPEHRIVKYIEGTVYKAQALDRAIREALHFGFVNVLFWTLVGLAGLGFVLFGVAAETSWKAS